MAEVTIISFNMANAQRDEQSEEYRFGKRMQSISDHLRALKAMHSAKCNGNVIICLQEIRVCKNTDGSAQLTPKDIVESIATSLSMSYVMLGNNPDKMSFHKATLWDPRKFFLMKNKNWWPYSEKAHFQVPTGKEFARSVMESVFIVLDGYQSEKGEFVDGQVIAVLNCHAPLAETGRTAHIKLLKRIVARHTYPFVVFIGDFNTLPDRNGAEDLRKLRRFLKHISPADQDTFMGYPGDCDPGGNPWHSRLDHAFCLPDTDCTSTELLEETIHESRVSDHYALAVRVKLHDAL